MKQEVAPATNPQADSLPLQLPASDKAFSHTISLPENRSKVLEMLASGKSLTAIAAQYGCSRQAVAQFRRKWAVPAFRAAQAIIIGKQETLQESGSRQTVAKVAPLADTAVSILTRLNSAQNQIDRGYADAKTGEISSLVSADVKVQESKAKLLELGGYGREAAPSTTVNIALMMPTGGAAQVPIELQAADVEFTEDPELG